MEQYTSRIEPSGRLLIPSVLRRRLGVNPGDEMVIEEDHGVLRVQSREAALRNVQAYFAQFANGRSWSEELQQERRAEAKQEEQRGS